MAWFVSRRNCPSFLTANTVAGPGKTSSAAPWHGCERFHSQPDGNTGVNADGDLTRPPDYPTALQTCARLVPERLLLHATLTIRPASPPRVAIIVGVWLPHAALIPSIGIRPGPFAFPCPSSFVSSPRPIASVDSGLGARRIHRLGCVGLGVVAETPASSHG